MLGNFFTEKFQAETESAPLNRSVCVFSEFKKHPFSGSSLNFFTLYINNAKKINLTKWRQAESLWFIFYVESLLLLKFFLLVEVL